MDAPLEPGRASSLPYNSLQNGTVIAFGVTFFFCTVFLGLRYFQALKLVKKIELDLIVLTISYGAALLYFITMVKLMSHGWGRHITELNMSDLIEFNKDLLPNTITYLVTPAITKLAMLTVLYRINPSIAYRSVVVAIGVAIFAYTLTLTTITGGPCSPLKPGTIQCLQDVALAQAVLNIVSDLAVVAVPLPTIHGLNLQVRQKSVLACVLAMGSGVVVCSIARLPYVIRLSNDTDVSYTEAILGVWSIVELNLGIICGCAIRLKPLLVRYIPQLGFFSSGKAGNSKSYASWGKSKELKTDDRKAEHRFQLHSIQKGSVGTLVDDGNIHILREYQIKRTLDGKGSDGGSTVQILEEEERHV